MAKINLRELYYWYTEDKVVEVSDEVAEALQADKNVDEAHRRRMRRNKTYSLETEVDQEAADFADIYADPAVLLEMKEEICSLCYALNSLNDVQGRRIETAILLGKDRHEIAKSEGVHKSAIDQSIHLGLKEMKIFMQNHKNCLFK